MSIENIQAFWDDIEESSDRLKEKFEARPDEQLSRPKFYPVPNN